MLVAHRHSLRHRIYAFLESSVPGDHYGYVFDFFMISLIIANVVVIVLETVASIGAAYGAFFFAFEIFSVAVFTVEYLLRVWACTANAAEGYGHPVLGRLRFILTPLAIIDLLAIVPFYLSAFIGVDLRILRIFRLLRLLKLTRYSPALAILTAVLRNQARALTAAGLVMAMMLVFTSSIVYVLEREAQPEVFSSIPAAMWWALATLTTVGFGDVTPITSLGKIFGGVTMLMGIGMLALPTGVIATGFAQEIRRHDFVVNWRLVSKVPLFSSLDAAQIAEIVQLLIPLVVPTNHAIVRLGEEADSMFFLVSGKVEIDTQPQPIFLEAGEYFGEIGLLESRPRVASAIALAECQLLELKAEDFWQLLDRHPALNDEVRGAMAERLRQIDGSPDDADRI